MKNNYKINKFEIRFLFLLPFGLWLLLTSRCGFCQDSLSNSPFQSSQMEAKRWNRASKIGVTVTGTALGIGYGFLSLPSGTFRAINQQVRTRVLSHHPGFRTHIDDYLQYVPALTVVSLKLAGIKGKYPLIPSITTFTLGSIFLFGSVQSIKYTVKEMRPDGSARNSFPSGHTSTAFAMAEWLRTEYGSSLPWVTVGGYAVATSVGVLRVFNNRHWVSDVVAGAAIGILSVRLAYWLKPYLIDPIFRKVPKSASRIQWF